MKLSPHSKGKAKKWEYIQVHNILYTDTRYREKNRYNDILTGMKSSLKTRQLIRNYAINYFKKHMFLIFC